MIAVKQDTTTTTMMMMMMMMPMAQGSPLTLDEFAEVGVDVGGARQKAPEVGHGDAGLAAGEEGL